MMNPNTSLVPPGRLIRKPGPMGRVPSPLRAPAARIAGDLRAPRAPRQSLRETPMGLGTASPLGGTPRAQ